MCSNKYTFEELEEKYLKAQTLLENVPAYPLRLLDGDIDAIHLFIKENDEWFDKLCDLFDVKEV